MAHPHGKPATDRPSDGANLEDAPKPGDALGPYTVEGSLGAGGTAEVLAAVDTRTGERVAIKLLGALSDEPGSRGRFRREFRALHRLNHPNIVQVFEWGLHGSRPWFSLELVDGHDLHTEVAGWEGMASVDRFARAQAILVQLARALDHLHDRGLVHGDLTPGNVLIGKDGRVKLTDFGLAQELDGALDSAGIRGTAAWIAPEQALSQPLDARTDLYALGALLYLMLAGRRPFSARSLQGFLDKHVHETPRPPIEIDPRVPPHLDQIARRLLQKRPADRFASASHLLHVLGELDPLEDREHWPPRLVGRTVLRAQIRGLLERVASGKDGGIILLQGAPGQGKTRLLDVAESQARRRGLSVARSLARPSDGPFGAFVGILRDLAPETIPDAVRAAVLGEGERPSERYPVHAAFRPLLTARAPAVVLLDDLHHADGATLGLLEYLIRNTRDLADEPILFVLGEEVEGEEPSVLEQRMQPLGLTLHERLGPLARSEVEELVLSLVADADASVALAHRLHDETGGSPAFLADMLRGLVDEGLIVQDGPRWRMVLDPAEITQSRLPMPASLRQALVERLGPLKADALAVGRALAVARRHVALDVLVTASPLDEEETMDAVDALVEAGIVTESRKDGVDRVELSHQRFQDVLLEGLDAASYRDAHQRMGEVLERHHRRHPGRVAEELTHHFYEAGIDTKAYAYLKRTAQRRIDASLWDEALAFIDRAIRMEPEARPRLLLDDADRALAELRLARAQCLFSVGRPAEAARDAREAVQLAEAVADPVLESRALVEHARQARGRGDLPKARASVERALERARAAHDPALRTVPLYEMGALAWADRDLEASGRYFRASLETAQRVGDEQAVGYGYNGLGILCICAGQTMEARRHLEQSARLFERLGLLAPLSFARANLSEVYHATGLLKKAQELAERTIAQAREVHHRLGFALGMVHRARTLSILARDDVAITDAQEAVRLTVELDSAEDELTARAHLAEIASRAGRDDVTLDTLGGIEPLLRDFDTEGLGAQILGWRALARARTGDEEGAREDLAVPAPEAAWPHVRVPAALARAQACIALEENEAALTALQQALHTAEACGYRLYQLLAHDGLSRVVVEESTRARHARVASALARSLAASLPRADGARFLARRWGGR